VKHQQLLNRGSKSCTVLILVKNTVILRYASNTPAAEDREPQANEPDYWPPLSFPQASSPHSLCRCAAYHVMTSTKKKRCRDRHARLGKCSRTSSHGTAAHNVAANPETPSRRRRACVTVPAPPRCHCPSLLAGTT
jgi:hypothetical protein